MSARVGAPLSAVGCAVGGAASGPVPVAGVAGIVLLWKHVAVVGGPPPPSGRVLRAFIRAKPALFLLRRTPRGWSGSPAPALPPRSHRAIQRERFRDNPFGPSHARVSTPLNTAGPPAVLGRPLHGVPRCAGGLLPLNTAGPSPRAAGTPSHASRALRSST